MKRYTLLAFLLSIASFTMAREGGGQAPKPSSIYDPFILTMVVIMLILLLAIIMLAQVVIGAAAYHREKEKGSAVVPVIALLLFSTPSYAQGVGGISPTAYYFMIGVIGMELLVVFALLYQVRIFLKKERLPKVKAPSISLWNKLNKFRPVEQEAQIDLGHDYDGIRELDNRLPPWWLYGFYVSILFAVVYLWRYHVSHTAPLSGEELAIAMQEAEIQKANYLKKTANNVDETTVVLMTGADDIAAGQKVFVQNCGACHGKAGEGTVGPNLTDDYWLHGGSVQEVFKSVKYGWPEKGMRSWKDDLSPMQIAQVSSYIASLHGSNPPNAKEKQGELYTAK